MVPLEQEVSPPVLACCFALRSPGKYLIFHFSCVMPLMNVAEER